jgi:integrase
MSNPFASIPKPSLLTENRQPFTLEELKTIKENLDDFTRPLFTIAIATALREGDICTLKWNEIDLTNLVIRREKMRKTQVGVDIPIMPPLAVYLEELQGKRVDSGEYAQYVLPLHAKMYLENRSGVSYRIKTFLEEKCHIVTLSKPAGRDRAVSVKDLHSCRHTFCYYAGLYGIPMNIVQGIVGHMTPEMTKLYSNHACLEAKREKMQLLTDFLNLADGAETQPLGDCSHDPEIIALLKKIPRRYANEVKQVLEVMSTANPRTIIELRRQLTS